MYFNTGNYCSIIEHNIFFWLFVTKVLISYFQNFALRHLWDFGDIHSIVSERIKTTPSHQQLGPFSISVLDRA